MSIKVMSMVFDRYSAASAADQLLALALADHARDDGSRIWPSVAELARKTRQSERTVQRQMQAMVGRGWLQVVRRASGRPGDTNEYRIAPQWIDGGEVPAPAVAHLDGSVDGVETGVNLSPVSPHGAADNSAYSVDKVIHTGDTTGKTGDTTGKTGDTAMSPESSGSIKNHIPPLPPVATGGCGKLKPEAGAESPKARPPDDHREQAGPNTADQQGPSTRPPWRWRGTSSGVQAMGVQLGLGPWDEAAFGVGQGEAWPTYRARVVRAFEAQAAEDAPAIAQQAARLRRSVARGEHGARSVGVVLAGVMA